MRLEHVAVIGAGAWGTALAQAAAMAGRRVTLVARDLQVAAEVTERHTNTQHLGSQVISDAIVGAIAMPPGTDFVIMAAPAQATRLAVAGLDIGDRPVVLSAKGLESSTLSRQSEVLAEVAPRARPLVLSGPSFAADVAAGRPTAVTLAANDLELADEVATALAGPSFRPYAAGDMLGVELAGALKNVYALGCGAVEGAGLGASARSALLARAFAELGRLIEALGGSAQTLAGLAGVGDLTLSCTSVQSRNYRYGVALGRGDSTENVGLAEGVWTAPVAQALARKSGIDAPLIDAVNLLLARSTGIGDIVASLMSRPLKREE